MTRSGKRLTKGWRNPMSTHVYVAELPPCDICKHEGMLTSASTARYDGKTIFGPWANMCPEHFRSHGIGLGTGRGQELRVADNT